VIDQFFTPMLNIFGKLGPVFGGVLQGSMKNDSRHWIQLIGDHLVAQSQRLEGNGSSTGCRIQDDFDSEVGIGELANARA
jgi:hypothetical protein